MLSRLCLRPLEASGLSRASAGATPVHEAKEPEQGLESRTGASTPSGALSSDIEIFYGPPRNHARNRTTAPKAQARESALHRV